MKKEGLKNTVTVDGDTLVLDITEGPDMAGYFRRLDTSISRLKHGPFCKSAGKDTRSQRAKMTSRVCGGMQWELGRPKGNLG